VSFWACAQIETNREQLALHCLGLAGFQTYAPRIRTRRITQTKKTALRISPLFPGYAFVWIELQWHSARWAPGVLRLVLDGEAPARVPDKVITDLRGRERNGLVELLPPPARGFRRGDSVRITRGLFAGRLAVFEGQRPHERVAVLLQLLGRVELPKGDLAAI
jgi:transcriptional antiterminator RfaH